MSFSENPSLKHLGLEEGNPDNVFEIHGREGIGAFGSVFKARYKRPPFETVAIKVIRVALEAGQHGEDVENVRREIQFLRECDHPNVTRFFGAYYKSDSLWIVMEYCGGGSVGDIVRHARFSESQIALIMRESLKGLSYLHSKKKIHRDIKGGNILLTEDGNVKIADFGVSAQLKDTMSRRGTFVGTPYWMSPEMIQDSEYDYKADVWSLGITAIEMADQKPPLFDEHPMRVLLRIPRNPPPTLRNPNEWSTSFQSFLALCLSKDPRDRPSSSECLEHEFVKCIKNVSLRPDSFLRAKTVLSPIKSPEKKNSSSDEDEYDTDEYEDHEEDEHIEEEEHMDQLDPLENVDQVEEEEHLDQFENEAQDRIYCDYGGEHDVFDHEIEYDDKEFEEEVVDTMESVEMMPDVETRDAKNMIFSEADEPKGQQNDITAFYHDGFVLKEELNQESSPKSMDITSNTNLFIPPPPAPVFDPESERVSHVLSKDNESKVVEDKSKVVEDDSKIVKDESIVNSKRGIFQSISKPYNVAHEVSVHFNTLHCRYEGAPESQEWSSLNKQFGVRIKELQRRLTNDGKSIHIPVILQMLKRELIHLGGLALEGIFRVAADRTQVMDAKEMINQGTFNQSEYTDPHIYACLIKIWLRDLPQPILESLGPSGIQRLCSLESMYSEMQIKVANPNIAIDEVLNQLPEEERNVLEWLLDLFVLVLQYKENRMTSESLSIVIAPNVYRVSISNAEEALSHSRQVATALKVLMRWRISSQQLEDNPSDPCIPDIQKMQLVHPMKKECQDKENLGLIPILPRENNSKNLTSCMIKKVVDDHLRKVLLACTEFSRVSVERHHVEEINEPLDNLKQQKGTTMTTTTTTNENVVDNLKQQQKGTTLTTAKNEKSVDNGVKHQRGGVNENLIDNLKQKGIHDSWVTRQHDEFRRLVLNTLKTSQNLEEEKWFKEIIAGQSQRNKVVGNLSSNLSVEILNQTPASLMKLHRWILAAMNLQVYRQLLNDQIDVKERIDRLLDKKTNGASYTVPILSPILCAKLWNQNELSMYRKQSSGNPILYEGCHHLVENLKNNEFQVDLNTMIRQGEKDPAFGNVLVGIRSYQFMEFHKDLEEESKKLNHIVFHSNSHALWNKVDSSHHALKNSER